MVLVRATTARRRIFALLFTFWLLVTATWSGLAPPRAHAMKFFAVPIFSTSPDEGNFYGGMIVLMMVQGNRTYSMFAPSFTYNRTIGYTGTFRWFYYPDDYTTFSIQPSLSQYTNRGISVDYSSVPRATFMHTSEWDFRVKRDMFYRFYGLGPQTSQSGETGYTRVQGNASLREGFNLFPYFNIGLLAGTERELTQDIKPPGIGSAVQTYYGTAGMGGATTLHGGASMRFDTRENYRHSRQGFATEVSAAYYQGLGGTANFYKVESESVLLLPESQRQQTALRYYWGHEIGDNIPFQQQISLGGDNRLRGFDRDRFIDKNGWLFDIEQRITLFYTHIGGITTDWQFTPFFGVGEVYGANDDLWHYHHYAGGIGMRAFCRPNMVGRFDFAWGGAAAGLSTYIELGFPF